MLLKRSVEARATIRTACAVAANEMHTQKKADDNNMKQGEAKKFALWWNLRLVFFCLAARTPNRTAVNRWDRGFENGARDGQEMGPCCISEMRAKWTK